MKFLSILLLIGSMAAQVKLGGGSTNLNGHSVTGPLACADTSGSGTAQACTTSPSFTPVSGDCVIYTTTTANTSTSLTLNVNGLGAKPVAKWQGATTVAANDVLASKEVLTCYDGTNWELHSIGNAPAGGTVTNSGTLTANAIALGAGTTVVKVDTSTSDGSGNLSATSITTTGTGTFGSGGGTGVIIPEGSCTGAVASKEAICGNSTAHDLETSYNNGSFFHVPQVIATGTVALPTGALTAGSCSAACNDSSCSNGTFTLVTGSLSTIATTDVIVFTPAADPTGVTGYGGSSTGAIVSVYFYPTSAHVNEKTCNNTGSSITPSALTVNWSVVR